MNWSYCPACGGGIDTGYECAKCGRDWREFHETKQTVIANIWGRAEAGLSALDELLGRIDKPVITISQARAMVDGVRQAFLEQH